MTERFDKNDMPDLLAYPSAQAQEHIPIAGDAAPPVALKNSTPLVILGKLSLWLILFCAIGIAILFAVLTRGSISHEQLRAQIESQFSAALGENHSTKIDDVKIAFGANGLIALDATGVKLLKNKQFNLGVAQQVAIKVKALPLLRGNVVAESLDIRGASFSLLPYLTPPTRVEQNRWPNAIDFSKLFTGLGKIFEELANAVNSAGLDNIKLHNVNLLGFDQLQLHSTTAQIVELVVEKNINYLDGLFFKGIIETQTSNWHFNGGWVGNAQGEKTLSLIIEGVKISDLYAADYQPASSILKLDNALSMKFISPYQTNGLPKQATLKIELGAGQQQIEGVAASRLLGGILNFRFFPEKNQIELERSPVQFEATQAILNGGVRYPKKGNANSIERPIFQLIAHNLLAYGMVDSKEKLRAALNIDGWIDTTNSGFVAEKLNLKTREGGIEGSGQILFAKGAAHLKADLKIEKMSVTAFKQFWPKILAPGARQWIKDGVKGGTIKAATVKLDFPPGVLGNDASYTAKNIAAKIPVLGSTVKTLGDIPALTNVSGIVNFAGTKTSINVQKAQLNLGKRGMIAVANSSLKLGDYTLPKIAAALVLRLKGRASAMAQLGTLKPLSYTKKLEINPIDINGRATATVKASFILDDVEKKGLKTWSASIKLQGVGSRRPLFGRKIGNANLSVQASSGLTKINGTASVDGVRAKLALVEKTGSKPSSQRQVSLTLNDAARKRMGADTGAVLTGPVDITLTSLKGGGEKIVADLKNARLNLPWIGWTKGKGIGAKAEFIMSRSKGVTSLKNFKLKGRGFTARGTLAFNNSGLLKASMQKVQLNKSDDFDVIVSRSKRGYLVNVDARSYDVRAIIQSFLKNQRTKPKGGTAVSVKGRVARLGGFGGQVMNNVAFNFSQVGNRVAKAKITGLASGNANSSFSLQPVSGGMQTKISTNNAGSTLRFLNLYSKMRGGKIRADLVRDKSRIYRGVIIATNFRLVGEPRLAKLLSKPSTDNLASNGDAVVAKLKKIKTDQVKIDRLKAEIEKGEGFLNLKKGRLTGGDASATFAGQMFDKNNRMNIKGTYLPGRALNRLVSKIPIIGLAFGRGKVNGLLGITYRLSGIYGNPRIAVNPLSIIAPGVFRQIFKF